MTRIQYREQLGAFVRPLTTGVELASHGLGPGYQHFVSANVEKRALKLGLSLECAAGLPWFDSLAGEFARSVPMRRGDSHRDDAVRFARWALSRVEDMSARDLLAVAMGHVEVSRIARDRRRAHRAFQSIAAKAITIDRIDDMGFIVNPVLYRVHLACPEQFALGMRAPAIAYLAPLGSMIECFLVGSDRQALVEALLDASDHSVKWDGDTRPLLQEMRGSGLVSPYPESEDGQ